MKQFTKEHFRLMPWKNGGGITCELYLVAGDPFKFRLSVATVSQDGPFSLFPGINRTLLILNGNGCRLKTTSQLIELKPGDAPFVFKGEEAISCELILGELQDFNVMIDRTWGEVFTSRRVKNSSVRGVKDLTFVYDQKEEVLTQLDPGEDFRLVNDSILVEVILR